MTQRISAPRLIAGVYTLWIAAGVVLLKLPVSAHQSLGWLDALFMATSAVTVTGLVVVDPGTDLTLFGQIVIALLIQLGGMGLMTFAVVVLSSLGLRIGVTQRDYLREELGLDSVRGLIKLAWIIFRLVVACELVGAAVLAWRFVPAMGWGDGLWQAVFHSISAFNNAGFSLFSDSLGSFRDDGVVLLAISALFIFGGLGFSVVADVLGQRRRPGLSLHTKLMLSGTLVCIAVGVFGYALLEWRNPATLGAADAAVHKMVLAWFEGVTPRTAGFNVLPTAAVSDATALLTMVLMIIGGGTTSTAGGVKVTTAVVLVLAMIAFFKQTGRMRAFGYRIDAQVGLKVMALLTVSVGVVVSAMFAILATHDLPFLDVAFEVTSAFGTVGLSRGVTGELSPFGQLVVMLVMFLGRIGPLSLGLLLSRETSTRVRYPRGTVYLG